MRDFAAVAGERDEISWQASTGRGGGLFSTGQDAGRSFSEQVRARAVLDTGEIRGLPEGTMLMFYKGLNPMLVRMTAYTGGVTATFSPRVAPTSSDPSQPPTDTNPDQRRPPFEVAAAQRLPADQDHPNGSGANHGRPVRTVGP